MLRKLVCAAVVVVIGIGVVTAEEFRATITKVEDGKVTFKKGKKGEEGPPRASASKVLSGSPCGATLLTNRTVAAVLAPPTA